MGEDENRYLNLTGVFLHNTGTNTVPYDRNMQSIDIGSLNEDIVSAWNEAMNQAITTNWPITLTTSSSFAEEDWDRLIYYFGYRTWYIPRGERKPIKIAYGDPYIASVDQAETGGSVTCRVETPFIVPQYFGQFTFDEADLAKWNEEDCGDCEELNEFLDSLQEKCDETV